MAQREHITSWRKEETVNGYLFLTPIFLLMGIFVFYCIFFVGKVSFYKWDGVDPAMMQFRGFRNYVLLFTDPVFYTAIKNVLIFMVFTISIQLVFGLIVAVLLRPKLMGHSIYKSLFYIPTALSTTVIARIFINVYEPNFGMLNTFFRGIGLPSFALNWLGEPNIAIYAIIAANIFQWMGAQMVFYIAGLTAISEEIYEAAQIDGAGFWTTLFKVIFPLLMPTHTTVIVLGMIGAVKTFDIVWLLTQGGPGTATQFMATLLYKTAVTEFKAGYGATIAVIMIFLCIGLSSIQNKIYQTSRR